MGWFSAPEYWLGRLALERGTAIIYLIAFVAAAQQFRPLIGEHGMLPVPRYLAGQSFWRTPSIFHFRYSDRVFAGVCWLGAVLSAAVVAGAASFVPLWATMLIWLTLWVLYLSIVNVGQAWYSFGWESLLLETGFLMIFLGNERTAPPILTLLLARWLLFRVEFGAGLIKMRGDSCWRSLTCLYYHHETQPMPGPLSWFFHHLPKPLHRIEVAGNHFAQLVVPFGLFTPQPAASIAAAIIVVTQLWLVASGNFSWLNWLTILLACSAIDTSSAAALLPMPAQPALPFLNRLLRNDPATLKLLRHNPFPQSPPRYVRAQLYQYRFTTVAELRRDRAWWHRTLIGRYVPPMSLRKVASPPAD